MNPGLKPKLRPREEVTFEDVEIESWGDTSTASDGGAHKRGVALKVWVGAPILILVVMIGIMGLIKEAAVPTHAKGPTTAGSSSLEDVKTAKELLAEFLQTSSIAERLEFVRHPEETRPRMVKHHERASTLKLPSVVEYKDGVHKGVLGDMDALWLNLLVSDGNWRTAVFEVTEGSLKLDWETFFLYEEQPWTEFFSAQSGEQGVFRVHLQQGDYYNYRYEDPAKYLSFAIEDPTGTVSSCWAYAAPNSVTGKRLARLFESAASRNGISVDQAGLLEDHPGEKIKVTLKLRFDPHTDGLAHSQAWVDEVVSDSWFVP